MKQRRRAYAYVTNRNRLLIFRHVDFPEAGIQVPAGTVRPREEPAMAVMREAEEETGLADLQMVRCLGRLTQDMTMFGMPERHEAWYFHLRCPGDPAQTWRHAETSGGTVEPIWFEFSWAELPNGVPQLVAVDGAMLDRLMESLGAELQRDGGRVPRPMQDTGGLAQLPDYLRELCGAWLDGLKAVLGPKLHAVYLYGAVVFPEGGPTGDVDFHVILRDRLDESQKTALRTLHQRLAREYPPLGGELDGYYILLADARLSTPPRHQWLEGVVDDAWALHRAHILAGRHIALYGPDPRTIYRAPDWPELEGALHDELYYVHSHLEEYPAYCVLNLCRLMYSFDTRDVVLSKRAAARWARRLYPQWQDLVDAAERFYDRTATEADVELLQRKVAALYEFAVARIPLK